HQVQKILPKLLWVCLIGLVGEKRADLVDAEAPGVVEVALGDGVGIVAPHAGFAAVFSIAVVGAADGSGVDGRARAFAPREWIYNARRGDGGDGPGTHTGGGIGAGA